MFSKLQYISQGSNAGDQLANIKSALDAGVKWIQLRYKSAASDEELIALGQKVRTLCFEYSATFIVNDDPTIAKALGADGVHVGLTDMKVSDCRDILNNAIVGGTANTFNDVLQRVEEGCDYIGVGPYRYTTTKKNLSELLGSEGYKLIMDKCKELNISVPVYAVGGILLEDIRILIDTGIYGVAVSGMITNDPKKKILIDRTNALFL